MAKLIIIAAIGKNKELGKNNELIWHLKEDLTFFKEHTLNHPIVMGYNTFLSLPKLLPKRKHLVLTHQNIENPDIKVFHDFNHLVKYLQEVDEDVYIIGGATIYKLFLPLANELLLTEINAECPSADVYFPNFNENDYERITLKEINEEISYKHVLLRRKK